MIVFTEKQWKELLAGGKVERTFILRPRAEEPKALEPCPYREGDDYLAKRDRAKNARMRVMALEISQVRDSTTGGVDWRVLFQRAVVPYTPRLLAKSSQFGYTDRLEKAIDPETGDPGEAPPANPDDDVAARREMAKRQAAVDSMRGLADMLVDSPGLTREQKRRLRRIRSDLSAMNNAA